MSREIKFRAWDGMEMQKVYAMHSNGIAALGSGGMVTEPDNIMQFTGLRDANGVEIYEGDIVKCHYFNHAEDNPNPQAVEYLPSIGFAPLHDNIDYDGIRASESDWEVIGNIYEHPHLLDGDK